MLDQSVIFYESALNRNPRDVNAVFGLALILREKRDYKSANQKMEEAISLDSNYVPVQLRRDRFEWQRYWLGR
jgi:tetratricopeptide (TPR) repeat protein